MNRGNDTIPASVEELKILAGGADIKGLEVVLDKAVHLVDGKKIPRGIDLGSISVMQHDALLLFCTLCKMGMKEETNEVTVKTRLLSLELLQILLGVSQSFTKNFHFIDSVKAYLFYALLRASVVDEDSDNLLNCVTDLGSGEVVVPFQSSLGCVHDSTVVCDYFWACDSKLDVVEDACFHGCECRSGDCALDCFGLETRGNSSLAALGSGIVDTDVGYFYRLVVMALRGIFALLIMRDIPGLTLL